MPDALLPAALPDPAECPLCGQPNRCAMAQGESSSAAACWCMGGRLADDVLAAVPESERGQRCICPRCARTGRDSVG